MKALSFIFQVSSNTGLDDGIRVKALSFICSLTRLKKKVIFLWQGNDFLGDFGKLPFPSHLGKYIIKFGKISNKIHEIWKIKAILDWE